MRDPRLYVLYALFGTATAAFLGCSSPDSESAKAAKTIDVPPALEIPIENDEVAAPRQEGVVGVLPETFPKSLPLHLPSSLIDFGDDGTRAWVDLQSSDPLPHVEQTLLSRARSDGWQVRAAGNGFQLEKGGVTAELALRNGNPGTVFRYYY